MSLADTASAFATVFVAELPDKTMVATIVLVARYRHAVAVWLGATAAFALHVTVAVVAGSAVGRLPDRVVGLAVFLLFTGGAIAMLIAARRANGLDQLDALDQDQEARSNRSVLRAVGGSFAFVALAEWGDLTQIATAGLAARSDSPISIWFGALVALATVAAIAASLGRQLVARIPVQRIQYVAAGVFAALAVWSLVEVIRSS